jgi:phosphohistidine phosphatase
MRLYLVQHGKPVSKQENPDRPLSPEGRVDVERVGALLRRRGIGGARVLHSGKTRARETAEILTAALESPRKPETSEGLSPKDEVRDTARALEDSPEDLVVVGHLPHLGRLTSLLVAGDPEIALVRFQQGGVVCLEKGEEGWTIAWMIVPEIAEP